MRELRCPGGHLHGEVSGRFVRRLCRQCSSKAHRPIYHTWDTETWEIVGDGDITE